MSLSRFFRRRQWDRERARELESHLAHEIDDNIARGMMPEEARRQAYVKFGNPTIIREEIWQMNSFPFFENLGRDVGYALRQLRKSPGFAITAILTLALGIGATASMFSVLEAVILHPLPYNGVDRIVNVNVEAQSSAGLTGQEVAWPEYSDMRRFNTSFSALAGVATGSGVTLTQSNQAIYLPATKGTDNFFSVFGVAPLLGRTFLPGEDANGKDNVVVLSYEVWRQDFGGLRSALGKVVHLDGSPYTVIGVMPAGFRYPVGVPDLVYTPLHLSPGQIKSRNMHWLDVIGRLKSGVTPVQARADLSHVLKELGQQYPDTDRDRTAQLVPIAEAIHLHSAGNNDRSELWVLLCAVFAVLLIACTNVAGLLLARGILREREMALRAALGAGRRRLTGQLLSESVVLGLGGGACGVAIAWLLLAAMKQFLERAFARGGNVHLNLPVLATTFGLALLTSVVAGLVPSRRAARIDPNQVLKSGGDAGTTRHQHRLRASFVVVQVALSLMLLVCSGLLLLGLQRMLRTSLGFNPENLLTLEVDIPSGNYAGRDFVKALIEPLEAHVRVIPGVTAVGSNNLLPIRKYGLASTIGLVGQPPDAPGHERFSKIRFITPGYFAAMQLPILRGRDFTTQDAGKTQPVAIVNDAWVDEFLSKGGDPLAHAFDNGDSSPSTAIVGVARSGRQNLFEPPMPEIDFPISQMPDSFRAFVPSFYLFVRTSVPPTSIIPEMRKALHDVAPDVAFRTPETMESVLSDALVSNRMLSWLFGLFAGIAVLLTGVGIYGLLSQEVAGRTRDIGVRMALGATRAGIAQSVLARVGFLLGLGLTIGLAGVWLIRRLLHTVLVIQLNHDGWAIAILVLALAAVGILAALLPARRAASVDPMQALRAE
ncbi:MAG: ADOP family duplicated permease [Acidobacteriaceae bacterium]